MAEEDSTLPRRQLGRLLRQYREEIGLTMAQAARFVEVGTTTLHRLERGTADKVRVRIVQHLCEIYERSASETATLKHLAEQAAVKNWYQEYSAVMPGNFDNYVELESAARHLVSYQELIPGLLQTEAYARTMIRNYIPDDPERVLEQRVAVRMKRQMIIKRKAAPVTLDVVVHESALRRIVGGPKIMSTQLRQLADASTRPNVQLQVLPFSAGMPMGLVPGPFVILNFGLTTSGKLVEPTVVYVESVVTAAIYLEKEADVNRYREVSAALHDAALDPVDSRALIRRIAKEYEQWT
ncbi:helix-turn-helix domain-containing protein [Nocardia nova]|uniref:helix-turn-helix domain-containing protein n=1 Tax=Nocardia nova TaxID=37330 RepID=UPI001C473324|nr:helix-turn-helix transcriptional regulator [Nocardia nova]MBV7705437.1 helix-turn-helix domain-containing protein [Nocardia nova]